MHMFVCTASSLAGAGLWPPRQEKGTFAPPGVPPIGRGNHSIFGTVFYTKVFFFVFFFLDLVS